MMEITEIRVKLMEEPGERLKAFCSITFDNSFVVRDLKIIDGLNGPFVAMPSRKLTAHCPRCRCKNHLKATFCNQCGHKLEDPVEIRDESGRTKLYADIAHPINSACREMIQERVLKSYDEELVRSQQPGYVSSYDDFPDSGEEGGDFSLPSIPTPHFSGAREEKPTTPHSRTKKPAAPQKTDADHGDFGAGVFE